MRLADRSPWFPGIMEEAYRQRYTRWDTMDWIFKAIASKAFNRIAIKPHLFPQVTFTILQISEPVNFFFIFFEEFRRQVGRCCKQRRETLPLN